MCSFTSSRWAYKFYFFMCGFPATPQLNKCLGEAMVVAVFSVHLRLVWITICCELLNDLVWCVFAQFFLIKLVNYKAYVSMFISDLDLSFNDLPRGLETNMFCYSH